MVIKKTIKKPGARGEGGRTHSKSQCKKQQKHYIRVLSHIRQKVDEWKCGDENEGNGNMEMREYRR